MFVDEKKAYENLANAIIASAYKEGITSIKTFRNTKQQKKKMKSIQKFLSVLSFFKSDWYFMLSSEKNNHSLYDTLLKEINLSEKEKLFIFGKQ